MEYHCPALHAKSIWQAHKAGHCHDNALWLGEREFLCWESKYSDCYLYIVQRESYISSSQTLQDKFISTGIQFRVKFTLTHSLLLAQQSQNYDFVPNCHFFMYMKKWQFGTKWKSIASHFFVTCRTKISSLVPRLLVCKEKKELYPPFVHALIMTSIHTTVMSLK